MWFTVSNCRLPRLREFFRLQPRPFFPREFPSPPPSAPVRESDATVHFVHGTVGFPASAGVPRAHRHHRNISKFSEFRLSRSILMLRLELLLHLLALLRDAP